MRLTSDPRDEGRGSGINDLGSYEWMRDVMGDAEAEEVYAELSRGGSPAARASAATASYRAREHWANFFAVADRPALASCALLFDEYPCLTMDLAERAIQMLRGRTEISPEDVVGAARHLARENDPATPV